MTTEQQAVVDGLSHAHRGATLAIDPIEDGAIQVVALTRDDIPRSKLPTYVVDCWGDITEIDPEVTR